MEAQFDGIAKVIKMSNEPMQETAPGKFCF